MAASPRFEYFLYRKDRPVTEGTRIWDAPFPGEKPPALGEPLSDDPPDARIGDYFTGARAFLEENRFNLLTQSASKLARFPISFSQIRTIYIRLQKHGEFYHPARVDVMGEGFDVAFVLNVALSEKGTQWIEREYRLLKTLTRRYPSSYLPEVFGIGSHAFYGKTVRMFLGEWMEGFHEFHHVPDRPGKGTRIEVWDEEDPPFLLSAFQEHELYHQISHILTFYYDIPSFKQIYPWHHAAGDFVVRMDGGDLCVKLVSARGYASMFQKASSFKSEKDARSFILHAILLFFLDLSIRIRIDRIGGVGEMIWADETSLQGLVSGFFTGLTMKPAVNGFPAPISDCFSAYLASCRKDDLDDLLMGIANRHLPRKEESELILPYLKYHSEALYAAIRQHL
ncbi:MAG: hypothetical protein V1714_01760 [Pseudomonadota bacterium]